ncbi:hypothetical protein BDQ17DRAFT_1342371 [Cyathus striatus]|nr:hypothetical protein BDQ17DRAFT_1342371 [Cyathus striatus]
MFIRRIPTSLARHRGVQICILNGSRKLFHNSASLRSSITLPKKSFKNGYSRTLATHVQHPVELPIYIAPPGTKEQLEYADLPIIDLAKARTPEGRRRLAVQLCDAMKTHGFFYAINHGYTQEETNKMFSITRMVFDAVPGNEKAAYTGKSEDVYEGYKPTKTWHIEKGVHDEIEHYNVKRHVRDQPQPEALRPYHNFFNILTPVCKLPEDTLVKQHEWSGKGFTTSHHPRSNEEEEKTKNVWLKGHTDIGSITILWSQPIAGLQILSPDEKWRWVRHMDNAVVVNAGDVLNFLFIQPPADQANIPRYGLFMFAMPNDDVKLVPHEQSTVLQRVGVQRLCKDEDAPTMEEWRRSRTRSYGKTELKVSSESGVEEELVSGVVVKHYN